jgi:hypothetical protein
MALLHRKSEELRACLVSKAADLLVVLVTMVDAIEFSGDYLQLAGNSESILHPQHRDPIILRKITHLQSRLLEMPQRLVQLDNTSPT